MRAQQGDFGGAILTDMLTVIKAVDCLKDVTLLMQEEWGLQVTYEA